MCMSVFRCFADQRNQSLNRNFNRKMAPRKRTATGHKKSNQNQQQQQQRQQTPQPSKFPIQNLFKRYSQNSLSQKPKKLPNSESCSETPATTTMMATTTDSTVCISEAPPESAKKGSSLVVSGRLDPFHEVLANERDSNLQSRDLLDVVQNPRNELDLGNVGSKNVDIPSQITPDENLIPVASNIPEGEPGVSPEICKSGPQKRFKFSPGMLIKQSQDDGGDEVTWRISPVNERLHAISKHLPDMRRVLGDSSRLNSFQFHSCSQNKISSGPAVKVEKRLSSLPLLPTERVLLSLTGTNLESRNQYENMDFLENSENRFNSGLVNSQSPFKTPPSCHNKPADSVDPDEVCNHLDSRQHKKALLELLDQVEDVICVDDSESKDTKLLSSDRTSTKISEKSNVAVKDLPIGPTEKVKKQPPHVYFLVFEVSEKQSTDSSGSQRSSKVLRLLNEQSGEERSVHLWDEWFYSVIAPGDTVHVIGEFDDGGNCDVNRDSNFLIVHPDILVSGTRVAASFSCPRRTVLDERLKSSEHSSSALIGTLLHQVFQAGLIKDIPTREFLEEYARILLQKDYEGLYACGVNEGDVLKTLIEAIPRLLSWILLFRDSQGSKTPSIDFGSDDGLKEVKITEVIDIEEMAWAPKYGLKGIIDASVHVEVALKGNEADELIMPLEFKTGKATSGQAAMEHGAQVMLYSLLMTERYSKNIDYGLLYYLHTDQTQGIAVKRSDMVGLIMRRNELASDILRASLTQQLPPMLQIPNMCKGCRHLNICTIHYKAHGGSTEGSGLGDVFNSLVNHLTESHCDFLKKWERLIDLEAHEMEVVKKEMWCSHSLRSARSNSSLSPIVLDPSVKVSHGNFAQGSRFIYRFVPQELPQLLEKGCDRDAVDSSRNDFDCSLKAGDYVVLSTDPGRLVVARGIIMEITRIYVTISFTKRLRLPRSRPSSVTHDLHQEVWRVDKDEFMSSFALMRFNLIQLFLPNERNSHLRRMIVDLEAPRYDGGCIFSQDPAISYIWSEKNLNDDQRRAILKILIAKDYTLVLGMPGTGKTSTMVHAVKALLMRGASILLTSYTNSAVDNLLIKLKSQGIDFIRIGRDEVVHEKIRGHCLSAADIKGTEDIKIRLDQAKVVAVTCLGITSPLLSNKRFDVCIMDEAGQTTLPVSLGPLMFASKFVLVGDHYQLPPLVQSAEARENGMAVSLFCRLSEAHPQAISALQSQYRMCAAIMELSNALIYGNRLCCGSADIENAKLKYTKSRSLPSWLNKVLDPDRPVIFINTDFLPAFEEKDGKTVNNPIEAHIISEIIDKLVFRGIQGHDIGVITPYNSQANLIDQFVLATVEIHTIDKYQGRDKDCILVSFVRSSNNSRNCTSSLLGDWHRINVALTRAKKKLVMVGSCRTLATVPLLKLLIEKVEKQSDILTVYKQDINHKPELKRCSQLR